MEDNKLRRMAKFFTKEGYSAFSIQEERDRVDEFINAMLTVFRSGFFGQGNPALICDDYGPKRVSMVVCTEDDGKPIYQEDELIRQIDPDNEGTHPIEREGRNFMFGTAIELNTKMNDFQVQNLLMDVWICDRQFLFLPKTLTPVVGSHLEKFFVSKLPRLSPVYFCFGENGLGGYTGIYLINISSADQRVEFGILKYHIEKSNGHLSIYPSDKVYGLDVDISIPLAPLGDEVKGEVLRNLSKSEYKDFHKGLKNFISEEIVNVDRSYLFKES